MDTHHAMQIFHGVFLVDSDGKHPPPYTLVTLEDIQQKRWRFNPVVGDQLGIGMEQGQRHLEHYGPPPAG